MQTAIMTKKRENFARQPKRQCLVIFAISFDENQFWALLLSPFNMIYFQSLIYPDSCSHFVDFIDFLPSFPFLQSILPDAVIIIIFKRAFDIILVHKMKLEISFVNPVISGEFRIYLNVPCCILIVQLAVFVSRVWPLEGDISQNKKFTS